MLRGSASVRAFHWVTAVSVWLSGRGRSLARLPKDSLTPTANAKRYTGKEKRAFICVVESSCDRLQTHVNVQETCTRRGLENRRRSIRDNCCLLLFLARERADDLK